MAWVLTDTMDLALPITQEIVEDALSEVSEDFSDICVDFKLCQYTELPNHRQDILVRGIHDEEIAALYRKRMSLIYISQHLLWIEVQSQATVVMLCEEILLLCRTQT